MATETETRIDDGGPAFPCAEDHKTASDFEWTAGMSLRDYFAGQALAGMMVNKSVLPKGTTKGNAPPDAWDVGEAAYRIADAVIEARDRWSDVDDDLIACCETLLAVLDMPRHWAESRDRTEAFGAAVDSVRAALAAACARKAVKK